MWYVFNSTAEAEASEDGRSGTHVVARNDADALKLAQERHGQVRGWQGVLQGAATRRLWRNDNAWAVTGARVFDGRELGGRQQVRIFWWPQ